MNLGPLFRQFFFLFLPAELGYPLFVNSECILKKLIFKWENEILVEFLVHINHLVYFEFVRDFRKGNLSYDLVLKLPHRGFIEYNFARTILHVKWEELNYEGCGIPLSNSYSLFGNEERSYHDFLLHFLKRLLFFSLFILLIFFIFLLFFMVKFLN